MIEFMAIEPMLPVAHSQEERCLRDAAVTYDLDYFILKSIRSVENGRVGAVSHNTDGSIDHGPMQINTVVLQDYAHLGITAEDLTNDACLNIDIGARHLRAKIEETGDTWKGVAWYHSKTERHGTPYARRVYERYIAMIERFRDRLRADRVASRSSGL